MRLVASGPAAARCVTGVIAIEIDKLMESKIGGSAPGLLPLFIEIGEVEGLNPDGNRCGRILTEEANSDSPADSHPNQEKGDL